MFSTKKSAQKVSEGTPSAMSAPHVLSSDCRVGDVTIAARQTPQEGDTYRGHNPPNTPENEPLAGFAMVT